MDGAQKKWDMKKKSNSTEIINRKQKSNNNQRIYEKK